MLNAKSRLHVIIGSLLGVIILVGWMASWGVGVLDLGISNQFETVGIVKKIVNEFFSIVA